MFQGGFHTTLLPPSFPEMVSFYKTQGMGVSYPKGETESSLWKLEIGRSVTER